MERHIGNEFMAKDTGEKMDKRVRIHFHSKRKRLIDPDGLYAKAALDGIVESGLLSDDSAECVKEIIYTQEKIQNWEKEETIIRLEW